MREIALIGMGRRFPESPDLGGYWRTVRDAKLPCYATRWFPGLVRRVIDREARSCNGDGTREVLR